MKKGHIIFIMGISGSGKGTMIDRIRNDGEIDIKYLPSVKTRKPRAGEIDGVNLIYMTKEEFKDAINRGEFLEYNYVHNQDYYGTRYKDIIDDGINVGVNILKELDITILPTIISEGSINREDYTTIFLDIPFDLIKDRMIKRSDNTPEIDYENRYESAIKEKKLLHLLDYVIDASQSEEIVYKELKEIIIKSLA